MKMQRRSRGLRELCRLLGYTSQAYYQYRIGLEKRSLKEELVIQQVIYHRRLQPSLGARKLLVVMQPFMDQHAIHIGRDVFFELLRVNSFLVRRKRRGSRTTFSAHRLTKYPDLIKGYTVSRANELWVSDITYIHLRKGFAYLSIITDAYSRRIMGFEVSRDLSAAGCNRALQLALKSRTREASLIHHSDRGIQYCSAEYVKLLNENQVSISMTQSGDPRDNAITERVNGILKQELLEQVYPNFKQAKEKIDLAIGIYNHLRPHSSVDMLTPEKAYAQTGEIRRRWKSYYKTTAKEVIMGG